MASRKLRLAAGMAVCTLIAAGCGTSRLTAGRNGRAGSNRHPVSVSMFGSQPAGILNLKTNWFTKYAERTFGIKFQFNLVPAGEVTAKEPLLLGSGNYPPVIWFGSMTPNDVLKYGNQGVFVPLNGLIKKYAPNVWRGIHRTPGLLSAWSAPNGKIYSLGAWSACYHCHWTYNYYMNIKDLDTYGLSMPKTTAQFAHVLDVFRQHGLVPLTGSDPVTGGGYAEDVVTYLMNAFIPYNGPSSYFDVSKGKVVFVPSQPQWRAGLQYIHGLYQSGDFSKVALTQQSSAVQNLISQQKVGVVPDGAIETAIPDYGTKQSHYLDWLKMAPLEGPHGVSSAAFTGLSFTYNFAITNKATKAQEIAVMKLLNFIWTPMGEQLMNYGPKGKDWTPAQKGQEGLTPRQALFDTNFNVFFGGSTEGEQNVSWLQWGPLDGSARWTNSQTGPPPFAPNGANALDYLSAQLTMAGHQPKWQYPSWEWVPLADAQTYATDQTNINNYVAQWTDEFITGQKSLSGQWKQYLEGLKNLDLKAYLQIAQQGMRKPENAHVGEYEPSPNDIRYLLCAGPVPALTKKYLSQEGVPASDFACKK